MTSAEVGVCIEVKPHPESPDRFIEICTDGQANIEYYGAINISLPKEQAVLLAKAILELAS